MKIKYKFPEGHIYTGDMNPEIYRKPVLALKAMERSRIVDALVYYRDSYIKPCDVNYHDGAVISFVSV
jgi:hypothetical protein